MIVTKSEYLELVEQNKSLNDELSSLQNILQNSDKIGESNNTYNEELEQLEYENDQLRKENLQLQEDINDSQVQITELQNKIIELENIFANNDNTSIDNPAVANDNTNKTSIFNMDTFQGRLHWIGRNSVTVSKSDFIDIFGEEHLSAYLGYHDTSSQKGATYLLNGNYSKCAGQFAWPQNRKDSEGSIWIEFYSDDNLIYQTDTMSAGDQIISFEFSVEGVEKLKIIRKGTAKAIYAIYPYFDLLK